RRPRPTGPPPRCPTPRANPSPGRSSSLSRRIRFLRAGATAISRPSSWRLPSKSRPSLRRYGGTNGEREEFLRTRLDREIATSRVLRDRIDRGAADDFVTHARQGGLERLESRL